MNSHVKYPYLNHSKIKHTHTVQSWLFESSNRSRIEQEVCWARFEFEIIDLEPSRPLARFEVEDMSNTESVFKLDSSRTRIEQVLAKFDSSNTSINFLQNAP